MTPFYFNSIKPFSILPITIKTPNSIPTCRSKIRANRDNNIVTETNKILEWGEVCRQVLRFTSTKMGMTEGGGVRIGKSREESERLLSETTAAIGLKGRLRLRLEGVEDVRGIVREAVKGEVKGVRELCAVKRTIGAVRNVVEELKGIAAEEEGGSDRYSPLLKIFENCNLLMELEQAIGFCLDCNLSVILDRASEDLGIIRSERKSNMDTLESLLKEISTRIYQAGGIDSPLVTKRRARLCVGVRATHRSLVPGGIVLNTSSSGATYFMEPRDAVELNNMEVRLSNSEKYEELTILSLLTSELAESESKIVYLLERILELDLASARAAYAQWIHGVCPVITQHNVTGNRFAIDIEGIRHPVLVESSLKTDGTQVSGSVPKNKVVHVVPIDIKIGLGRKVIVISGPNTGGKTASMKTLGLASLMSKAGLYLPAKNIPKLPWFDLVLADIGDHQSLEQNLSTFSGHISRICGILELATKESLVLIDEIGSGTDPSEGVALSTSILQYLKDQVGLAVVTTHYADLSCLKENDLRFENAAMEFCLETLQPTYHVLWGSIGNSNALSIAKSIGFDPKVLDKANKWMKKLTPDKQMERKGMLYLSLIEERNMLEAQARKAESLNLEIMELHREIQSEAEDLDKREAALKAKETYYVQREIKAAKSQIDVVVKNFENQLNRVNSDQCKLLIKSSEGTIGSIVNNYCATADFTFQEVDSGDYEPQVGEKVLVSGLGTKFATIIEAPGDDGTALVQYGKIKARVKKRNIKAITNSKGSSTGTSLTSLKNLRPQQRFSKKTQIPEIMEASYGTVIQTSENTMDLRGMRVEEVSHQLNIALSGTASKEILFIIHGMGTGVVKEFVLKLLQNHPRVAKFEQESPMNYGCTIAYLK